jgi:hypothetical protein
MKCKLQTLKGDMDGMGFAELLELQGALAEMLQYAAQQVRSKSTAS